jgi:hypothetical protein
MHCGHQTMTDSKGIMNNFGQWGQTVRGTRRIADDLQVVRVLCMVDTHHKHWGVIFRRRRHNHLLSAADEVLSGLLGFQKLTCNASNSFIIVITVAATATHIIMSCHIKSIQSPVDSRT